MSIYTKKQLSHSVKEKLSLWFEDYNISKIHKEYNLDGYRCNYFLETKKSNIIIELNLNLKSNYIGKLLSYIVLTKRRFNKNVIGCLIFYEKTIKELELSIDIIKYFNLNILLLDFQENKLYKKSNIDTDYNIHDNICIEGIKCLEEPIITKRKIIPECMNPHRNTIYQNTKKQNKRKIRTQKILPMSSPKYKGE